MNGRVLGLSLLAAALCAPAQAQRVRHEYVPPSVLGRFQPDAEKLEPLEPGEPLPASLRRDGEKLAPPAPDPKAPTFDQPGGIDRPTEARPDRATGPDSALQYHAMFNPSVAPLRRNVAFDRVEADYRLTIEPGKHVPVALSPREAVPGRELFWGEVKLTVRRGLAAPLPSVAPDMRILAVDPEPAVKVSFEKDAADNVYLRAEHDGPLRVVFLVDADSTYFSGAVPGNVPVGTLADRPAAALPPAVRQAAQAVLDRLGVTPDMPFDRGLNRLVEWFRGFEAGELPEGQGDIYLDLALGRVGVCRHRAFAFVITARAAGIPTRQVQNEAHAFVEVLAPDNRWRRIDLGGEAPSLTMTGAEDRRLHTPPPDAFPKPENYLKQYSGQLAGSGGDQKGGSELAGVPPRLGQAAGDERAAGGAGAEGPTSTTYDDFESMDPPATTGQRVEVPLPEADGQPAADAPEGAEVKPVRVSLEVPSERRDAFRGESLPYAVTGQVVDLESGGGVGRVRVQVYLLPEGGRTPTPVGAAVRADREGRFSARVSLPSTLELGPYRVVVASEAAGEHAAGRSDAEAPSP